MEKKPPEKKGFSFSKLIQKFKEAKPRYVKRYFKVDSVNSKFIQADNGNLKNVSYTALFRDIVRVTKNLVTMPDYDENEPPQDPDSSTEKSRPQKIKEVSVSDLESPIDRGPRGFPFVVEIHLSNRIFTLFTDNKMQQDQFFDYVMTLLAFK